ncbi:nipblb [Symbiodinium pilosum]|uniref:Nipblb protein n=1 Tax=Symbiodinium pilosum TaxID=2952 RepID=A0A812W6P2_SYMPI|nr:nipblb [Symbiodinium pilosum]
MVQLHVHDPMSWHKAELSARVTWIGWAFDFEHFVVQLDPAKLARLLALLRQLQSSPKCTVTVLEKLTGKLLWLSNLFSALRPSLAPLYLDQHNPVVRMWADLAASPCPFRSLFLRPLFVCEAFADACADSSLAGLGGFVRLPDGRQACFACSFSPTQLADMFSWFPSDTSPQHCIAVWEMLVQVGLLWTLSVLLPPGHAPFHVVFRTDNSPSQSAAWKGLSLARGMRQFLRSFNVLQDAVRISVHLDSVPGFLNDAAEIFTVPWTSFPASPSLEFDPSSDLMSAFVAAELNFLMALFPSGSSSLLNCLWIPGHQKCS